MEERKSKRIYWIDVAKIIAMVLIILSHTIAYSNELKWLYKYVCSFHVAFFFVISGLTFKIERYSNYNEFIKEKFKKIMIPYFIFTILFLIPYIIMGNSVATNLDRSDIKFDIGKSIIGIFYGNGHDNYLRQNSSLWFLPCLFTTECIFYFIEKWNHKNKYYIAIILSIMIGMLDYYFLPFRLPWGFDIAICMIAFFTIGKIISQREVKETIINTKIKKICMAVLFIIIGMFLQNYNTTVMYMHNNYGKYMIFVISAIFSILGYINLIKLCPYSKILEYAGKRTLAILIFHKLIVVAFQTKIKIVAKLLKSGTILEQIASAIFVIMLSIVISLIIEKIVIKIAPIALVIQKKEKKEQ